MRLLSIDVGIKNLACCTLDIKDKTAKIVEWDVIDLCNNSTHICCGYTKGKKCKKTGKYNKNEKYYCKTHAKHEKYKLPTKEINEKKIKKASIKRLKELCGAWSIEIFKGWKKADYLDHITKYYNENYFDIDEKTKTTDLNLIEYGKNLKEAFSDAKYENLDIVIIENQIGPLALKMKVLQGMIMQHFIEVNCQTIEQISPANKLKNFIGTQKTTYGERKKLGIKYTREIIIKDNSLSDWCQHFEKHKKKDYLADSFLQAIWYMKNKKLIN